MINGSIYRDMVISAANAIENVKEDINSLNVFPVPDGDTGINMSLTMQSAKRYITDFEGSLSDCSEMVSNALLRGGRGNSGVILSLFFRGMAKEFKGKNDADSHTIAKAFTSGAESAYKAVRHPTEGTILTVMRMSAEAAEENAEELFDDRLEFFNKILDKAKETLKQTPEMLPILKQANVVDAGGKGFVVILEGMVSILNGTGMVEKLGPSEATQQKADFSDFHTEDINFAYCTESIVNKSEDFKKNGNAEFFEQFLSNMGDSVVFLEDENMLKFHLHTNDPGKVLSEAIKHGTLNSVKIENMKEQHTDLSFKVDIVKKKEPEKKYGFVSVVAGNGLCEVFKDLGVDNIVNGGQTMNPSTDDIVNAVNLTPSEIVFVLPNNKNIYMAAKQAEEIVSDKKVVVLKSVSVPQGISMMLSFNAEADLEENIENMKQAMKQVKTARVTFAARNSVFDNSEIKEGQILGLLENEVKYIADSKEDCIKSMAADFEEASYITLFYGEGTTEEDAQKMVEILREQLGEDKEIVMINGGQPVYYYIISAE